MVTEVLNSLGLSIEESEIYSTLLDNGQLSASEISKNSKVKRTYVYAVCKSLIKKGLIQQLTEKNITKFAPLSPDHLMDLAERQKQDALKASQTLEGILPTLKQKYSSVKVKPTITYYEGIEGLKKIYKDILHTKKDITLFRSIYDDKRNDIDEIIIDQIKSQVRLGIKTRTITPLEKETKNVFLNFDKINLVDRHILDKKSFDLSSQIIIYGSKTAFISLKKDIVVTLLDNQDITNTFLKIFNLLWSFSETEHNKVISSWK